MKYTIINVNDRAKKNIDHNRRVLLNFEYVGDIPFCNGNTEDAKYELTSLGIADNAWRPYDGRMLSPLPGEYGIWVSTIRSLQYMLDNELDSFLILEDDAWLLDDAESSIMSLYSQLPKRWDFLSLFYAEGQNTHDESTDIGHDKIHKSINQPAGAPAMMYSLSGAKKILKLAKRKGMEYTSDCFIFEQARIGALMGYSIIPESVEILLHTDSISGSIIDPENLRHG
jgi:GR25 family glycosyltransferase involved in LPS biosynthesis